MKSEDDTSAPQAQAEADAAGRAPSDSARPLSPPRLDRASSAAAEGISDERPPLGGPQSTPSAASSSTRGQDETAQMRRVLGRIRRQKRRRGKYSNLGGGNGMVVHDIHEDECTPPPSPDVLSAARGLGAKSGFRVSDHYDDDDCGVEVLQVSPSFGVEERRWCDMMCPKCCRCCIRGGCFCSNNEEDDIDDIARERPTNEMLLSTAFVSFTGFTILQSIVAFIAKSKAMLGDSAAMAVDALTYAFNLVAERMKNRSESEPQPDYSRYGNHKDVVARARQRHARQKRKLRVKLELIPPLVSVMTLVVVTGFVLNQSIRVLILDAHRSVAQQSRPNIVIMGIFSAMNLGLDFLNVFCFARARHAMGFATMDEENTEVVTVGNDHDESGTHVSNADSPTAKTKTKRIERRSPAYVHLPSSVGDDAGIELNDRDVTQSLGNVEDSRGFPSSSLEVPELDHTAQEGNGYAGQRNSGSGRSPPVERDGDANHEYSVSFTGEPGNVVDDTSHSNERANLNMCSAYTHVFADTLRSIAVVVASVLAELVEGVTPEEADAMAAVVVSLVILLSLIPLLHGMSHTWSELREIRKEEKAEQDLPDSEGMSVELEEGAASTVELGLVLT